MGARAGLSLEPTGVRYAAEGGHLEILMGARARLRGTRTRGAAARGGHFEILKWARERGCPWDARTCAHGRFRCLDILEWVLKKGCE